MDTATKAGERAIPWNKGKLLGQKPPLNLKEIWAIRIRLQLDHRTRDLALFNLAVDSILRGCDLVALRVHDVVQGSRIASGVIVMQKKTQRLHLRAANIATSRCEFDSLRLVRVALQQQATLDSTSRSMSHQI